MVSYVAGNPSPPDTNKGKLEIGLCSQVISFNVPY